jgi:hypothetical protein
MIYRFNLIPIKIPITFFTGIENPILKFLWNLKGPKIVTHTQKKTKNNLKKDKAGTLIYPDFKTHYKVTIIQTVWYR